MQEYFEYVLGSWIYTGLLVFMWIQGLCLGYILWAPESSFKKGFQDTLSMRWLWDRKK